MSDISINSEYKVVGDNTYVVKKVHFQSSYCTKKDINLDTILNYAALFGLTYTKKTRTYPEGDEYVYQLMNLSDQKSLTFSTVNVPIMTTNANVASMYRLLGISYTKLTFDIDGSDVACFALSTDLDGASKCFFEQRRGCDNAIETTDRKICIKIDKMIVSDDIGSFRVDSRRDTISAITYCKYTTFNDYISSRQYKIIEDVDDDVIKKLTAAHKKDSVACVTSGCSTCSQQPKFKSITLAGSNSIATGYNCIATGYNCVACK